MSRAILTLLCFFVVICAGQCQDLSPPADDQYPTSQMGPKEAFEYCRNGCLNGDFGAYWDSMNGQWRDEFAKWRESGKAEAALLKTGANKVEIQKLTNRQMFAKILEERLFPTSPIGDPAELLSIEVEYSKSDTNKADLLLRFEDHGGRISFARDEKNGVWWLERFIPFEKFVSDETPTAEQILDNYLKFVGGQTTLSKLDNFSYDGKTIMVGDIGKMELNAKVFRSGNKFLQEAHSSGQSEPARMGFDGETAWMISSVGESLGGGTRLLSKQEYSTIFEFGILPIPFDPQAGTAITEVLPSVFIGDFAYDRIRFTPEGGTAFVRLFRSDTGEFLRLERAFENAFGEQAEEVVLLDFQPVGDVRSIPHKLHRYIRGSGIVLETTFSNFDFSPEFDENLFDLPDEIKELVSGK